MKYIKIEDGKWLEHKIPLAYQDGIALSMSVRVDGYGNAIVRFELNNHGVKITYEKYNSATEAYRMACDKAERMTE